MAHNNRWLLPEGIEEILPGQAWQIERFQRRVLDLYHSRGYELVIPPLIEYSESLLIGMGSDMDLQTFKLTDQLSGRTLAIRADITPQTARIDAHSWQQQGPTRLCYAGTVVHTRPRSQLASRLPLEVGAELYGDASLASDIEIISLMLATIAEAGIERVHLDLGHIGIYRGLVEAAGLDSDAISALDDAFERKAAGEVAALLEANVHDDALAGMIRALIDLHGDLDVLDQARQVLAGAPAAVQQALQDLTEIAALLRKRYPHTPIVLDLAELRGYRYHTGLVYAAYINGIGHSVANGGRYDGIGKQFGRSRPATGFSANVHALLAHSRAADDSPLILAPAGDNAELLAAIDQLRSAGKRVVQALPANEIPAGCRFQLINDKGQWHVVPL